MNATTFSQLAVSAVAAESITAFRFVDGAGTTTNTELKCSIADSTDAPIGIAQNDAASGEPVAIAVYAITKLTVNGSGTAISIGDRLKPDGSNTGKGIKTTTDNDPFGAISLGVSSADGDMIDVIAVPGFRF